MNPGKLGLTRRSGYRRNQRARYRRNAKLLTGLACLVLLWTAYAAAPRRASSWSALLPDAPDATVAPSTAATASTDPVAHAASSKPDIRSLPESVDAALPVAATAPIGQTESGTDPADDSTVPIESAHVPFLQSVMASADRGAAHFGYPGGYGGMGGGWGGGGGAGTVPAGTPESQYGDTGNERANLLALHAVEDTSFGDSTDSGSANGDENNQGSNNQGSNNQGSNNQGSNNQGSNNQGQGSNNQGSNNQGSNNQGSNSDSNGGAENGFAPQANSLVGGDTHPSGGEQGLPLDVPEPGLLLLTGVGLAALGRRRTHN